MRVAVTEPSSPPTQAIRRRPIDLAWASLVVLVPVVVALLSRMGTTDLTYHIRAGDGILATHSLPRVDTYTFSVAGRPWLDQQWGAQIVLPGSRSSGRGLPTSMEASRSSRGSSGSPGSRTPRGTYRARGGCCG